MKREERALVVENREIQKQLDAGFRKAWLAGTISLWAAAKAGLKLERVEDEYTNERILHWEGGRITILRSAHGQHQWQDTTWDKIVENEQKPLDFLVKYGMLDQKALDYIAERRGVIAANNKKLERFMLEKQLEEYKQKLEKLDD